MLWSNRTARIVTECRICFKRNRISFWCFTRWVNLTCKNICNGCACCLSAKTWIKETLNLWKPRHKNNRTACKNNDCVWICSSNIRDKLVMIWRHIDCFSVVALTLKVLCKTCEHDSNISVLCNIYCFFCKLCFSHSCLLLFLSACRLVIALCISNIYAEFYKFIISVWKHCRIDNRRTCALEARSFCHLTDNSYFLTCLKRKNAVIILKKNHWAFCNLLSNLVVSLFVICMCLFKSRLWLQDEVNNSIYSFVKDSFVESSVLYGSNDFLCIEIAWWWHFEVCTCFNAVNTVNRCTPVCYNKALKAPFLTENLLLHPFILWSINTVNTVVRVHNCPRLSLFNCNFKCREINLTHCTLINNFVENHTECFLWITSKVLKRCTYALWLNTVDDGGWALTCKKRIFWKILKVSATCWSTLDICTGTENNGNLFFKAFFCHSYALFKEQIIIPRAWWSCGRREASCRHRVAKTDTARWLSFAFFRYIVFTLCLTQAVRAVCNANLRESEFRSFLKMPIVITGNKCCLLLKTHFSNDFRVFHKKLLSNL